MSSTHELAGQIDATKHQTDSLAAGISADIQQAEEAKSIFQQVGAESSTSLLEQVESQLEEAQSIRETLAGSLEKARWQVMAVINGVSAGNTTYKATSSASYATQHDGTDVAITVNNEQSSDSSDRHQSNNEVSISVGPDRSTSGNSPDRSKSSSKFRRVGRIGVRKAEDLKENGKEITATFTNAADTFMKTPEKPITSTEQPTFPAAIGPQSHHGPEPGDIVGNSIVWVAMGIEAFSRRRQHRKKKDER